MATPAEIVDRGLDAWRARDEEAFVRLYSEDAEILGPHLELRGKDGVRQFYALWMEAFPDNELTVHNRHLVSRERGTSTRL